MTEPAPAIELSSTTNISKCRDVLRELLMRSNLNVTELARRTQLPQPTIHRLLTGKTEDPKLSTLSIIAEYFSISLDQLLGNIPLADSNGIKTFASISIPVLTWQDTISYQEKLNTLTSNSWEQWVTIDTHTSHLSFGLKSKKSMEPRFPAGSILIIDPNVTPSDGDLVIVHYPTTAEATVRELVLDGPRKELVSLLDDALHKDEFNEDIKLIGVVIQTRFFYK